MIEQVLEAKIIEEMSAALSDSEGVKIEFLGARQPSAEGYVKGNRDTSAAVVVSTAVGFRAHDSFSLPTVNISGIINVSSRVEMAPNGASHELIMAKLADLFTSFHGESERFSETFSNDRFYATELRLDGGSGKSFDSANAAWTESFNFTVRGVIK